jgi:hypothetical protein
MTVTAHSKQSLDPVEEKVRSAMLVIWMALVTAALRIALEVSNVIILYHMYGRATVQRLHLRIVGVKPQLVVSNGDVLRGIGPYHYFLGVAIWLLLSLGLISLVFYTCFPRWQREIMMKRSSGPSGSVLALLWALALFFMVPGLLPISMALTMAVGSIAVALIWARKIEYGNDLPE